MKKQTKLFKHFMTSLYIGALGLPILFLVVNVCRDVFPKLFASFSVQHHGGSSDVFANDLDYAKETLQFNDFNDTIMTTLDQFNYFVYDETYTDYATWITNHDDTSYNDISDDVNTHLLINFSIVKLFDNGTINRGVSVAPLLLVDFMCNYLVNMTLICFLPQVIMCFIKLCTDLVYTFVDKGKED